MSRRYAASERIWAWSSKYGCRISIIQDREINYYYEPPPPYYDPPKSKHRVYHVTTQRIKKVSDFLCERGEVTVSDICNALDMSKTTTSSILNRNPSIFQVRIAIIRRRKVYLWSLREEKI